MSPRRVAGPPRWQDPLLDEAALDVARRLRGALAVLRDLGQERWVRYLEPLLPVFEDGDQADLLAVCRRARAAFGPRDSLPEAWPSADAPLLRDSIDRLQRLLDRRTALRS
ncbi:MAG: hypothetical protein ACP5VP_01745 [Candidatus Limnocylindrales bacterium]